MHGRKLDYVLLHSPWDELCKYRVVHNEKPILLNKNRVGIPVSWNPEFDQRRKVINGTSGTVYYLGLTFELEDFCENTSFFERDTRHFSME